MISCACCLASVYPTLGLALNSTIHTIQTIPGTWVKITKRIGVHRMLDQIRWQDSFHGGIGKVWTRDSGCIQQMLRFYILTHPILRHSFKFYQQGRNPLWTDTYAVKITETSFTWILVKSRLHMSPLTWTVWPSYLVLTYCDRWHFDRFRWSTAQASSEVQASFGILWIFGFVTLLQRSPMFSHEADGRWWKQTQVIGIVKWMTA